jgi:hypothetical protein
MELSIKCLVSSFSGNPPILEDINSCIIHSIDNSPPGNGTKRLAVVVTLAILKILSQLLVLILNGLAFQPDIYCKDRMIVKYK